MKAFSCFIGSLVLIELSVHNVLFARNARIAPGAGLTVISGETGSGKSLLLGALQLVLGGRASARLVGDAAEHATVTAVFEQTAAVVSKIAGLAERHGITVETGEAVIMRRQISARGRTQAWVNDTPVSIGVLRSFGEALVDVQGQHEPLRLSERRRQMEVLDAFGGHQELSARYQASLETLRRHQRELETLSQAEAQQLKERDYCRYLLDEIADLDPQPGEYEELEQQQQILSGAEEWRSLTQQAAHELQESDAAVNRRVGHYAGELQQAPDARLREAGDLCAQAESLLQDAAMLCLQTAESLQSDPEALRTCEGRLASYVDLMRKHGGTATALLDAYAALQQQLEHFDHSEDRLRELETLIDKERQEVSRLGEQLAKKRRQVFKKLAQAIQPHLDDLGMPEARISLNEQQDDVADNLGTVHQEFLVQTNPGIAAERIGSVASGGEYARLALALALVLGDSDNVPVMVFDEIDSGVGARLGVAIGRKLSTLAQSRTVVVITHTPQVAAMAQHHYLVRKKQTAESTDMEVCGLQGKKRLKELTDMLGGGPAAAQQADELLALA